MKLCYNRRYYLQDMGLLAISILINMCENNPENLQILRNQIQPVNLMKRVSAAHYGILAGKLCHVLDGIHQAITAADVVSYLLPIDAQMTKALMYVNSFLPSFYSAK